MNVDWPWLCGVTRPATYRKSELTLPLAVVLNLYLEEARMESRDPLRERNAPNEVPDSLPGNAPSNDPFPERQPREIPLRDPPGGVIGDPIDPDVADPEVEDPKP